MRRTQLYRIMPWVGGINTSVDPGVLNPQELVQADNVQFSSTGARIKREALQYLDDGVPALDFRSSSGTTRTLTFTSNPLINTTTPNQRLVVGEHINVSGNSNYNVLDAEITSITGIAEVTSITTVADVSGSLAGKYFLISAGDEVEDYYVWFNVSGSGVDPEIGARTGVEVMISTNATATTVAAAVAAALNPLATFAATSLAAVVTVTASNAGYAQEPAVGTSGFTILVTTQGGHSITYEVPTSFSESTTAAAGVAVERASAVISLTDYWYYSDGANVQLLVYATDDFQLFRLDESGGRQQIFGQPQTTTVVTAAASTLTTGDYFLLNGPNDEVNYYVWYNKAAGGGDPLVSDRTGIEVAVGAGDTAAQVASATQAAIDAQAAFSATVLSTTVTITSALAGVTTSAVDFNTGFVITTTAFGATAPSSRISRIRTIVFNERLLMAFSGIGNYPIKYNPDESPFYQLITPPGDMPDASFLFLHLGRVWADDKNNRDYIHYSETFDETLWLGFGDSGALPIFPGDGDPEGITNGYVYKGFAVIGKKDARYRVLGDSPENFFVERISSGMGNEGPIAIPVDEVDVVFVSKRGFHSQQATDTYGDTDAAYLSADIKSTFNAFEAEQLKYIQGTYIPELNSIAMSITERGEQSPMDVWLYNVEAQTPGKDRPGAWYRWPNISCTALSRRYTVGKHKLIFGTQDGRVIQAQKENDFADFGTTGISFMIKTGTLYPGNDPQTMKAFKRITMIYRPRGNFSFAVLAKIDNHEQQGFAFNEISGLDLLGETFILGESILGSSNTLAPFTFTMEGYGRGVTLTVTQPTADEQVEIWGFVIEYENVDLEQEVQ